MIPVVNPDPPVVAAADEGRHEPGPAPLWNESWYLDVADRRGDVGCYLRLGLYPNTGRTWLHLAVAGRDRPLVLVADEDAPPVAPGPLHTNGSDWTVSLDAGEPLRRWHVTAAATGRQFDDPLGVYRGETGTPVDVGLDLTWTTVGEPYHYGVTTRYEVTCTVIGALRVGDEVRAIDGTGQRDHSWGVRDWWAFGWCWSAGTFTDGTAFHLADIRLPDRSIGFGYTLDPAPGGGLVAARAVLAEEDVDGDGVPRRARIAVDPGLDAMLTPIALAPLRLVAGDGRETRFPRALCRYRRADGTTGAGWTEWNQPVDRPTDQPTDPVT